MLPTSVRYAIVYVTDMARSVAFYRDTLGLPVRFETPFWTELATDGVTIALHGGAEPGPARKGGGKAGQVSLGFQVDDMDAVVTELIARDVTFELPPQDRPDEGIRLATLRDPDGTEIALSQLLAGSAEHGS